MISAARHFSPVHCEGTTLRVRTRRLSDPSHGFPGRSESALLVYGAVCGHLELATIKAMLNPQGTHTRGAGSRAKDISLGVNVGAHSPGPGYTLRAEAPQPGAGRAARLVLGVSVLESCCRKGIQDIPILSF